MRLIDADKLEAELRKTKFLDENDKVIVCAVIENAPREGYEEFEVKPTWKQVVEYCHKRDLVIMSYEAFAKLKSMQIQNTTDTIYGYPVEHLILLASACRQQGITDGELHNFVLNVQSAYDYVYKGFENSMNEYFRGMMVHETD